MMFSLAAVSMLVAVAVAGPGMSMGPPCRCTDATYSACTQGMTIQPMSSADQAAKTCKKNCYRQVSPAVVATLTTAVQAAYACMQRQDDTAITVSLSHPFE